MKRRLLLSMAVMTIVAASYGQSIVFNDSSYVYLDDNITALGDANEHFTMEAWVKPDTTGGWKNWCAAAYLRNAEGASLGLNITNYRTDTLEMIPLWQDIYWIAPNIYIPVDAWCHIAMTVDVPTSSMKGYLNGELVYTYVAGGEDFPELVTQNFMGTEPLCIGKDRYDLEWTGRTFKGGIDEVRIWNKTLSDEEIATNWNVKLNGDEADLVAYYDFTTVIGTIVTNGGVGPTATLHFADNSEAGEEGAPEAVGIRTRSLPVLENVNVYANSNTIFVRNGNGLANIEVLNVLGQVVVQKQIEGDAQFTMSESNVYIVKVSSGDQVYATKVLIK